MTGQDAVNLARDFNETVGVTGIVLTRVDGDARGGAALSMRAVTGAPIKFLGAGEKLDALEEFHPTASPAASSAWATWSALVEKAMRDVDQDEAEKLAAKMAKGKFDLEDYASQFRQIEKMGDLKGIIGMLPGIGKMQEAARRTPRSTPRRSSARRPSSGR